LHSTRIDRTKASHEDTKSRRRAGKEVSGIAINIEKHLKTRNTGLFTWMDRIRASYRSDRLENHETRKYSHGYTGWTGFKIV